MPSRNTNGYRLPPPSWLIEFIHNTCINTRLSFPDLNSITPDFNFPPAPCRPTTDNGYVGQVQCNTWFNECWSCCAMMRLQTFIRLGTLNRSMIKSFTFWVQCLDTCWTSSSVLRLITDWQVKKEFKRILCFKSMKQLLSRWKLKSKSCLGCGRPFNSHTVWNKLKFDVHYSPSAVLSINLNLDSLETSGAQFPRHKNIAP